MPNTGMGVVSSAYENKITNPVQLEAISKTISSSEDNPDPNLQTNPNIWAFQVQTVRQIEQMPMEGVGTNNLTYFQFPLIKRALW